MRSCWVMLMLERANLSLWVKKRKISVKSFKRSDSPIYIFTQTRCILSTFGSMVAEWVVLLFHSSRASGLRTSFGICLCGVSHGHPVFRWAASHLLKHADRRTGCVKLTLVVNECVNVCVHSAVWWSGILYTGFIPDLPLVFSGLALICSWQT